MFEFRGPISASKSWFNRALVIQHFDPTLKLESVSDCDDVIYLKKALQLIGTQSEFDLGLGGTSFRFFVFLISRLPGDWTLRGHERLLQRPQQELIHILNQLGVKVEFNKNALHIQSQGWDVNKKIVCSAELSSQFVSGLLLSCWNLNSDLEIEINKPIVSYGYLKMTIELLRTAGMTVVTGDSENFLKIVIPQNQKIKAERLEPVLDISSAFSLIGAGIMNGHVEITNWTGESNQPDVDFLELLKKMNISYRIEDHLLSISKQTHWNALDCNLNNSPDLFPVLAVLCAFASGVSTLRGGTQLVFKESNRILKTKELLDLVGVKTEVLPDGLRIYGQSSSQSTENFLEFDPDHDHRMAMAAGLLKLKGYNLKILNPEVVNKSYPSFWKDSGIKI